MDTLRECDLGEEHGLRNFLEKLDLELYKTIGIRQATKGRTGDTPKRARRVRDIVMGSADYT